MLYHIPDRVTNITDERLIYQDKEIECLQGLAWIDRRLALADLTESANSILGIEKDNPCAVKVLVDMQGNGYSEIYALKEGEQDRFASFVNDKSGDVFTDIVKEKYFRNVHSPITVPLSPKDSQDLEGLFRESCVHRYTVRCNDTQSFTTQSLRHFQFEKDTVYDVQTIDFKSFTIRDKGSSDFTIYNASEELIDTMLSSSSFELEGETKVDTMFFVMQYKMKYAKSIADDAVKCHLYQVIPRSYDTINGIEDCYDVKCTDKKILVNYSYGRFCIDDEKIPFKYDVTVDVKNKSILWAVRNYGEFKDKNVFAQLSPQERSELIKQAEYFAQTKSKDKEEIGRC